LLKFVDCRNGGGSGVGSRLQSLGNSGGATSDTCFKVGLFSSACVRITQRWFYSVTKMDIGRMVRLDLEIPEYSFEPLQHVQTVTPDLVSRRPEALGRVRMEERQVLSASNANNLGITAFVGPSFPKLRVLLMPSFSTSSLSQ